VRIDTSHTSLTALKQQIYPQNNTTFRTESLKILSHCTASLLLSYNTLFYFCKIFLAKV
jgi:hypothetical protein